LKYLRRKVFLYERFDGGTQGGGGDEEIQGELKGGKKIEQIKLAIGFSAAFFYCRIVHSYVN